MSEKSHLTNRYAVTDAIEEHGMASAHNDTFSVSGLWRFEKIFSGDQDKGLASIARQKIEKQQYYWCH